MQTEDKSEKQGKVYTIDDIAKELGVSKTTVSRAISGKGRISKSTTKRVLDFIQTHDYRPNVMARGLAQSKSYNIGTVLPMEYEAADFQFFKECLCGICGMASEYDYDVLVSMERGHDISQIERMVNNRKVDGVILTRTMVSSAVQQYLKEKEMPLVVIGPTSDPDVISVDNKNREASRELTEILLMKGFRRLALIGGKKSHRVTESRYQGFADAYGAFGITLEQSMLLTEVDSYADAMNAVQQALAAEVQGIVCMDDFICNLVLSCLQEKRVQIPQEIKLASFYDSRQLEYNMPPVTSVRFRTEELGRSACKKMLKLLGENIPEAGLLPGYQVILRDSTK